MLSLEVLRTHHSSLSGPGSASGSGGASAVSNEILTLVFSLVTKVWLFYLHQQNHPMKQPRCLSCSVCWNWTATPSHRGCKLWKGPSLLLLSFRTPISAFSLEARKCILLIQSRLNISFSECSPGSCCRAPPPLLSHQKFLQGTLSYGSDRSHFPVAGSVFLHVLIALADRLGLKPQSLCCVSQLFASLSCAVPNLVTALGQTGSTERNCGH